MYAKLTVRYDLGVAISAPVFWNTFLVKPTKEAAGQIDAHLFAGTDFVQSHGLSWTQCHVKQW